MSTAEERADLNANPLPPVVVLNPLYVIRMADLEIAELQERISKLNEDRQEAMDFAIANNVIEEGNLVLKAERSVRKTRALDLEKFREVFPNAFELACAIERKQLEEQIAHIGEKIPLGVVDKLIPKKNLAESPGVVTVKESVTVTYTVVAK